ncbi:MAG: malectin domain-containing carbohydrate-binding protein, partial [Cyanobacteria bacterium P01_F01_bin.150]
TVEVPPTGGFDSWQDIVIPGVLLDAGTQAMRTDFVKGAFDFNYIELRPAGPDVQSPLASLVTSSLELTIGSSANALLTVSYQDNSAVDVSSLDVSDIQLTNTNGSLSVVDFTSTPDNDGSPVTVVYEIAPPNGTWQVSDAATYSVALVTDAVQDTSGNANSAQTLGDVAINVVEPFNEAPVVTGIDGKGIADVVVAEGSVSTVIDLYAAFDDFEDPDQDLQYTVQSNSNSALVTSAAVNVLTGELSLDYAAVGTGAAQITVRATDTGNKFVETTFTSTVVSPLPADGVIRINAGGVEAYDTDGNLWQADTNFIGGTAITPVTRPIENTLYDSIYQAQRSGNAFDYQIPVANGSYNVNFHIAELVYDSDNQRTFDVSLEGDVVFDDLDLHSKIKNAFLDGIDTARVLELEEGIPVQGIVSVSDGVLDVGFNASLEEAMLAGLEIIPLTTPQIVVLQSNGTTQVVENGASDTYELVLTTQPAGDVTINIQVDAQVNTDIDSVTFTSGNWYIPQTVTVSAVNDALVEGGIHTGNISHTIETTDPAYSTLTAPTLATTITDNDSGGEIAFTYKSAQTDNKPTRAAWGPDGRLYITTLPGYIEAYTFDDDYNVVGPPEVIDAITSLDNNQILGIAFNPYDLEPKIYVAHNQLKANGGKFFPDTEFSPYSGQVSVLEKINGTWEINPQVTGIGVSNHDHGINGLDFDNQGNLYIAVGGNTNAGIVSEAIGGLDESPFTAAILKAEINKPDFNGAIEYTLPDGYLDDYLQANGLTLNDFTLEDGSLFDPADSQVFGDVANVAPGVDVSVYASGIRNSFDLVWSTSGKLYATDNGANGGAGDAATGADTQENLQSKQFDELLLVEEGEYYGSPNRNRGRTDPRQNIFRGTNKPYVDSIEGEFTAPIGLFEKNSTNGIDEYRSTAFNNQLRGNLLAQEFNSDLWSVDLNTDGTGIDEIVSLSTVINGNLGSTLDVLTGPGGVIIGVDLKDDLLSFAIPDEIGITGVTAYDIFPWRAPAVGGSQFTIGGLNFSGDLADTTVTIGGEAATLTDVSDSRIRGIIPDLTAQPAELLDIIIQSAGETSVIADAFLPLIG